MPDTRIHEILTELGANASSSRVHELVTELGDLLTLATVIDHSDAHNADIRLKHIRVLYSSLRTQLRTIERQVEARDKLVSAKLHQLGNAFMGLELRLMELADAIALINDADNTRARIVGDNTEISAITSDDDAATI